jgi:glycosyltransferase involved in cell wall biosynthesis
VKILILARHLNSGLGGIEIQCDLIARHLIQLGHSVVYGAAGGRGDGAATSYPLMDWQVGDRANLRHLIDQVDPDVIYLRHNKIGLRATASIAREMNTPLIYAASSLQDVQGWAFHRSNVPVSARRIASIAWQRIKSRWNWSGLRWVSGAVSLNSEYTHRLPVVRKLHIPDSMESDADPFHWPRPFVTWVAQLKDYKRPEAFVELSRRMQDQEIDFLMVGSIVSARYRWIADHSGTPPNFHFLGSLTPRVVNGLLQQSLALVHTCDPEGFGNNFIQAWQQGKPTLSLQFDPGGNIARHGLGVVPGSIDGLERYLRILVADPTLRAEISARALEHSREYDPLVNVGKLATFFAEIVATEGKA